jgi:4-hydroxy-tetrahydrodipicolinate synthase
MKTKLWTLAFIGLFTLLLNQVAAAGDKSVLPSKNGQGKIQIWSAIPTPFMQSGQIDEAGIRKNVRHYIDLKLDGVFCNGLMGEGWSLTIQERKRILEVLVDEAKGKLGVSIVISANSLPETLELGLHAKQNGATHSVILVPSTGPRSYEQMLDYFKYIFEKIDMPIVVFNAKLATNPLKPEMFEALCRYPNFIMLKSTYPENNSYREIAKSTNVIISHPSEDVFFKNMEENGQTILYADPEGYLYQTRERQPIREYIELYQSGKKEEAKKVFDSLAPFRSVYNKWIMNDLRRGHMPNAALKTWCEYIGMAGGNPRIPVSPLTNEMRNELYKDLDSIYKK